jgi:hypothetical protein
MHGHLVQPQYPPRLSAGRLAAGVIVVIAGAGSAAGAAAGGFGTQAPAPAPLRAVSITFYVEGHERAGAMGASTVHWTNRVGVGEAVAGTFGAGIRSRRDICLVQSPADETSYLAWKVRAVVRSVTAKRIDLDLDWSRTAAGGGIADHGSGAVTLEPGKSHLVDIVAARPGEPSACSHVSVRMAAARYSPMPSEILVHRLWLVHERDGKRWTSEPIEAIGAAGQAVTFRFRPLEWTLDGAMTSKASGPHVDMDVFGAVTTELSPDGRFEAAVDVTRETRIDTVVTWGGGHLRMSGRLGEAGELELPARGGFFSGTRTSLVMTVERIH